MTELLPCPFCGGAPRLSEPRETPRSLEGQADPEEWIATIDCDTCDPFFMRSVTTSQAEATSAVIAAWNRRTATTAGAAPEQKTSGGFYRRCSADTPGAEWAEGVGYHVYDEQARIEGQAAAGIAPR